MMVRLDFSGDGRGRSRAMRVALQPDVGVSIVAEPGPRLPFRDTSVDEVFLGRMIAWRADLAATLDDLWRVCKPGAL